MTLRPARSATMAGCLATAALCVGLAGAGAANAAPTSAPPSPSASPAAHDTTVPAQPVASGAPTSGGTDIEVPAGNAGPTSRPTHGAADWELAGLLGAGAALLGGAGVVVARRR